MTTILDGTATAAKIRGEVAAEVARMTAGGARRPGLAAVLVGDDPASSVYVGSKTRACEEAGLLGRSVILPGNTDHATLARVVDELNAADEIDGILVQLPLPKHLPEKDFVHRIRPDKDVDGFHPENVGRLWLDEPGFAPATPSGVIEILKRYQIPLAGARAVVIGRSAIVGKPMAALLVRENATVTICHSRTRDLPAVCREADILVAAIGRPGFVTAEHVKQGATVVDVGINRVADAELVTKLYPDPASPRHKTFADKGSILVGDVDYSAVAPLAGAITPVPGGVGPLTVAMLLVNTLTAAKRRQGLA